MAQTLQNWIAQHPSVEVAGDGGWLVFKPCLNKARRFESYFSAHCAVRSHAVCKCDESHFILELEEPRAPVARSFQKWVEAE